MTTEETALIFCSRVKALRQEHKLTQKKMAQIMGIGVATLRMIESGHLPKRLGACVIVKLMVILT